MLTFKEAIKNSHAKDPKTMEGMIAGLLSTANQTKMEIADEIGEWPAPLMFAIMKSLLDCGANDQLDRKQQLLARMASLMLAELWETIRNS